MRLPDLRLALATGCPKAQAHAWGSMRRAFPGARSIGGRFSS